MLAAWAPASAGAQPALKIFDAHLHYNQEPNPYYPLERVLEVFRRNNVAGILANSRPNKGTHQLVDAKAPGLWVVPFIRPYRTRDDVQNWSTDPAIYDLVESEHKRGYYRGVGEFHIYGKAAQSAVVKKVVEFAAARDLYLLAHCDEAALLTLHGTSCASQDHLGAYRLLDLARAGAAAAGDLSGADGRAFVSRRHHRGGRQALRPNGASCSRAIPTVSSSGPIPGSMNAGSATTPSSRPTAAGWRSCRRTRPGASPMAMASVSSAASSNDVAAGQLGLMPGISLIAFSYSMARRSAVLKLQSAMP